MGFSQTLDTSRETSVLQSFTDTAAGRSLQLFYGTGVTDSGGTTYVLSRDAGFSRPISYTASTSGVALNFNITNNKMTIIAGIVQADVRITAQDMMGAGGNVTVTAALYHYDGSTETLLGSATTDNLKSTTITQKFSFTATRKSFGVGSTLRLKMTLNGYSSGPDREDVTIYFDPLTAGNELKLWVPVVVLD